MFPYLHKLDVFPQHGFCRPCLVWQGHDVLHVLQRLTQVVVHRAQHLDLLMVLYEGGTLCAQRVYHLQVKILSGEAFRGVHQTGPSNYRLRLGRFRCACFVLVSLSIFETLSVGMCKSSRRGSSCPCFLCNLSTAVQHSGLEEGNGGMVWTHSVTITQHVECFLGVAQYFQA